MFIFLFNMNDFLQTPTEASPQMLALYDQDPGLWPSVRKYNTVAKIIAECKALGKTLRDHPTNQTRRFQIMRNKRKLLFAKKILLGKDHPPPVALALSLSRFLFEAAETRLPGDPPYDKRARVAHLMEVSAFFGSMWASPSAKEWTVQKALE